MDQAVSRVFNEVDGLLADSEFIRLIIHIYQKHSNRRGLVNVFSFLKSNPHLLDALIANRLMGSFFSVGATELIHDVHVAMTKEKIPLDAVSYSILLRASARMGEKGRIISAYRLIIEEVTEKGKIKEALDVGFFNQTLKLLSKQQLVNEMKKVYVDMTRMGFEPNQMTFQVLLDTFSSMKKWKMLQEVFLKLKMSGLDIHANHYATMIYAAGKRRDLDLVHRYISDYKKLGITRTTRLYTSEFNALVSCFDTDAALSVYDEAIQDQSIELGNLFFINALLGFGKMKHVDAIGMTWELAKQRDVVEYPVLSAMLDAYARTHQFKKYVNAVSEAAEMNILVSKRDIAFFFERLPTHMERESFNSLCSLLPAELQPLTRNSEERKVVFRSLHRKTIVSKEEFIEFCNALAEMREKLTDKPRFYREKEDVLETESTF